MLPATLPFLCCLLCVNLLVSCVSAPRVQAPPGVGDSAQDTKLESWGIGVWMGRGGEECPPLVWGLEDGCRPRPGV